MVDNYLFLVYVIRMLDGLCDILIIYLKEERFNDLIGIVWFVFNY